jgi:hypothetical protein
MIYVVGGFTDSEVAINTFEKFDIEKNFWMEMTPCMFPAANPTLVMFGESCLIKFGGKFKGKIVDKMERYDFASNSWSEI